MKRFTWFVKQAWLTTVYCVRRRRQVATWAMLVKGYWELSQLVGEHHAACR